MKKNLIMLYYSALHFNLVSIYVLYRQNMPSMQELMHKTGFAGVLQHNLNGVCRSLLVVFGKHAC